MDDTFKHTELKHEGDVTPKPMPCPHCGGDCSWYPAGGGIDNPFAYFVLCSKCGAQTKRHETLEEAVSAWNARANDAQRWIPFSDTPPDGAKILVYSPDFSDSGEEYQVLKWDSRCKGLEEFTHWQLITKPEEKP